MARQKTIKERQEVDGKLVGTVWSITDMRKRLEGVLDMEELYFEYFKRPQLKVTYCSFCISCLFSTMTLYSGIKEFDTWRRDSESTRASNSTRTIGGARLMIGLDMIMNAVYELTLHQSIMSMMCRSSRKISYIEPLQYQDSGKYSICIAGKYYRVLDDEWNMKYHELTSRICRP